MTDDLALAVAAAGEAGVLAMRQFRGNPEWWNKSPGNPVSEVDLACDAYLRERLLAARPDYGWLSEETADNSDRLAKRRLWVVDPIDGTRDYVRGRTGWCVSVAVVEDGRAIAGALACPARELVLAAGLGHGATCNGVPIAVSGRIGLDGVRLPIDASNMTASFWPSPWPGEAIEKPNSLALRIAKVATGEADVWLEGRSVAEWDCAAAALILTEAGGTITDRHGAPLAFNQPEPVFAGVVATTPALHGETRDRLDHAIRQLVGLRRR